MQVDLRAVERSLALGDLVRDLVQLERGPQRALGHVPLLVGAEPVVGPGRELRARRHAEELVEVARVVDDGGDLVLDLLLRAEDVRVVLRDVRDAEEAVERARQLVAVERRRLGERSGSSR